MICKLEEHAHKPVRVLGTLMPISMDQAISVEKLYDVNEYGVLAIFGRHTLESG